MTKCLERWVLRKKFQVFKADASEIN